VIVLYVLAGPVALAAGLGLARILTAWRTR
jgi:hypothetical protein